MFIKRSLFIIIIISLAVISGYSQAVDLSKYGIRSEGTTVPEGLKVGEKAPDFVAYDQNGKQVKSQILIEKGPVVIFFYRGKWCSVCDKYLSNYQDSVDMITGQGVSLVAITPESIENVEQSVKNNNLSFTVLYDCEEKIMKDYDVLFEVTKEYQDKIFKSTSINIAENNGRDFARLPIPATYIINRAGVIVATHFNPDFNYRASVKWVLNNLSKAL